MVIDDDAGAAAVFGAVTLQRHRQTHIVEHAGAQFERQVVDPSSVAAAVSRSSTASRRASAGFRSSAGASGRSSKRSTPVRRRRAVRGQCACAHLRSGNHLLEQVGAILLFAFEFFPAASSRSPCRSAAPSPAAARHRHRKGRRSDCTALRGDARVQAGSLRPPPARARHQRDPHQRVRCLPIARGAHKARILQHIGDHQRLARLGHQTGDPLPMLNDIPSSSGGSEAPQAARGSSRSVS